MLQKKFFMIKYLCFSLFMLPIILLAQNDFDTRYFTINAESLPDVPKIEGFFVANKDFKEGSYSLAGIPTYANTLQSFQINADNYWQPVDIATVLNKKNGYVDTKIDLPSIQQKQFGVIFKGTNSTTEFSIDSPNGVKNQVYKEQRAFYIYQPGAPNFYNYSRRYY